MKQLLEKISLLSLSFMLVSTFAVSPALPKMIEYYQGLGYTAGQVSFLFSVPSFAVIGVLLLTPFISKFLSQHQTIILGLLLLSVGGSIPVLTRSYHLVFVGRIFLGIGIGLINAHAINIISERYSGKEKIKMLGMRASTEVLGSASLTFFVGQLMVQSWSQAYLVYSIGFFILLLYLLFVPPLKKKHQKEDQLEKKSLSFKQILYIIAMSTYAGLVILINSVITLRIPQVVSQLDFGTSTDSSLVLSSMMLMGIFAGMIFNKLQELLKNYLLPIVLVILGTGLALLWQSNSIWDLTLGAMITGFTYCLGVIRVFQVISERIPRNQLITATTLVLLGCNLGGGISAIVDQLLGQFSEQPGATFSYFAFLSIGLGMILLICHFLTNPIHKSRQG
ncbi:MFS transporter [Streptococcus porcorum]|uniref:MFS family permease n=1 Tax=Streptococcus porcorum TaxID=701526 RepID=A0ABV2JDH6_9STRE